MKATTSILISLFAMSFVSVDKGRMINSNLTIVRSIMGLATLIKKFLTIGLA